jgi:hypothetical protein
VTYRDPQFLSSLDHKSFCKLNISTKNYLTIKDKLFFNTYHQNRQKKHRYWVFTVVGEYDRPQSPHQLQSKTESISIKTLMIVGLWSVIKVGPQLSKGNRTSANFYIQFNHNLWTNKYESSYKVYSIISHSCRMLIYNLAQIIDGYRVRNLRQCTRSLAHRSWIHPADMRRPKKVFSLL